MNIPNKPYAARRWKHGEGRRGRKTDWQQWLSIPMLTVVVPAVVALIVAWLSSEHASSRELAAREDEAEQAALRRAVDRWESHADACGNLIALSVKLADAFRAAEAELKSGLLDNASWPTSDRVAQLTQLESEWSEALVDVMVTRASFLVHDPGSSADMYALIEELFLCLKSWQERPSMLVAEQPRESIDALQEHVRAGADAYAQQADGWLVLLGTDVTSVSLLSYGKRVAFRKVVEGGMDRGLAYIDLDGQFDRPSTYDIDMENITDRIQLDLSALRYLKRMSTRGTSGSASLGWVLPSTGVDPGESDATAESGDVLTDQ